MEINKIHNENCIETMLKMPSENIDLVLTSPPYDDLRNCNVYSFQFDNIHTNLNKVLKSGISTKFKIAYKNSTIFHKKLTYDQIKTWSDQKALIYNPFMNSKTIAIIEKALDTVNLQIKLVNNR